MRRPWMDRLRCATVALVLVYHVFYLLNHLGVAGAIGRSGPPDWGDGFITLIYPWFMVLLFALAGISARYALAGQGMGAFLRRRCRKLLLPVTTGLLVYQWIGGYYNVKLGGGLAYIPAAIRYPVFALSGIGPLWFVHLLLLYTLALALLRRLDRHDRLWRWWTGKGLLSVLALGLLIWGGAQVGNVPVLTVYRVGIYAVAFFAGYLALSQDSVQASLRRWCPVLALAAANLGAAYLYRWFGTDYTQGVCLQSFLTNAYLWVTALALIGLALRWWNGAEGPVTAFCRRRSYGLYVLHYPVVLAVCDTLAGRLTGGALIAAAVVLELGLTLALYELLRRLPGVRYLVLGMKNKG